MLDICPNCNERNLVFMEKYKRFYCKSCKKYAPKDYFPPPESKILGESKPQRSTQALTYLSIIAIILSCIAIGVSSYAIVNNEGDTGQGTDSYYQDKTPPEKVTELTLDRMNEYEYDNEYYIKIKWKHVSDNIGVDYYKIYFDGVLSGISNPSTLFYNEEKNAMYYFFDWFEENTNRTINIQVLAVDGAGNEGEKSDILTITIP